MTKPSAPYDAIVIGAGAAGMMAAAVAGQRGLRVLLVEHADRLAEKIRISGGGRCNFTNTGVTHAQFLSRNPHFCRSALAAYTPRDFISLVDSYRIGWHEKHRGQLFCDESSEDIIRMLKAECDKGRVAWRMPCAVRDVAQDADGFVLDTSQGALRARQVVLATGGMAIPQLGATDFALKIARQFGLKVVEPRPALVPLVFDATQWQPFAALAGVALEANVSAADGAGFLEDMLFTHRGLSGPAILQISSYWNPGEAIQVDLAPGEDLGEWLVARKRAAGRQQLPTALADRVPRRLADAWEAVAGQAGRAGQGKPANGAAQGAARLADMPDGALRQLGAALQAWQLQPAGTAGYRKAEVMRGGIDTRGIDQKTMQARSVPGLFAVGESLDVTGWLGGYNFQWAWSSGVACGRALRGPA